MPKAGDSDRKRVIADWIQEYIPAGIRDVAPSD